MSRGQALGFGMWGAFCLLCLSCQLNVAREGMESVGTGKEPLQLQYLGGPYWYPYVSLVTSQPLQEQATGAIRYTSMADQNRGNCGVTFVSKHYAITADHCVSYTDINIESPVTVEQYDTTNIDTTAVTNQSVICANGNGLWPDYHHCSTLSSANGYNVTTNTCYVTRRCDVNPSTCGGCGFGRDNCDDVFGTQNHADLALIYCPNRPSTTYAPVATSDDGVSPVEVWWFHEVVYLNRQPNETLLGGPTDNWDHYGDRSNYSQNYHYYSSQTGDGDQQLLPLLFTTWPNAVAYYALGTDPHMSDYIDTNVPVCHGTSGSGVFHRGDTALLGVVASSGSQANLGSRLCTDMDQAFSNAFVSNSAYQIIQYTQMLQSAPEVQADL